MTKSYLVSTGRASLEGKNKKNRQLKQIRDSKMKILKGTVDTIWSYIQCSWSLRNKKLLCMAYNSTGWQTLLVSCPLALHNYLPLQ